MAEYNSIHTGAQIDEAVGRALSGRAGINPNLLDNWYFGNPVDQRGGYVVPPGTPYYTDTDMTSQAGTTTIYYKGNRLTGTYSEVVFYENAQYVVPTSSLVRGYIDSGYGIDRWHMYSGTLKIQNDIIELSGASNGGVLEQRIENPKRFAGKTVTLSVLGKRSKASWYITVRQDGVYRNINLSIPNGFACASVTFVADSTLSNDLSIAFACWDESDVAEIKAVKLELGSQQTLAHQDENGNWVLNEIPNYAEELAKCQRYFYAFDFTDLAGVGAYWGRGISSTEIELYNLTFPVTMRINPALNNLKVYEDGSGNTYDVVPRSFLLKKEGLRRIDISSGMTAIEGRTYVVVKAWISAEL